MAKTHSFVPSSGAVIQNSWCPLRAPTHGQNSGLVAVGAGITRVIFHFGFMETPDVMEGLKLACLEPELHGIDPQSITYYFRRVMVIPGTASGIAVWRKSLFATMHPNANLPATYFGVPAAQVVEGPKNYSS